MADFIDAVITTEGGATNDPADAGGRTEYGISETSNPGAWADGVVTLAEAREIYLEKYYRAPGFDKIAFLPLQHQLVDFGVNAGPGRAIKELQKLLGCRPDGDLGPHTLLSLRACADLRTLNNQLVDARKRYYRDLAKAKPRNQKFLNGWLKRAQEFFLGPR